MVHFKLPRVTKPAHVYCKYIKCPEFFGSKPLPSGCVKQRAFDSCCTLNRVCDKEEISKLLKCELEGKTYREGEKMFPDAYPCYSCICGDGFDPNMIETSPFCRKINCSIEHQNHKLQNGCIPVYYSTNRCCPIDWRCRKSFFVIFQLNILI